MSDEQTLRRKRLKYRSSYRGTKELDLILGRFADHHLDGFSDAQLDRYEAIMDANEHEIYAWLTGRQAVPAEYDNDVMTLILNFKFADTIS